MWTIIVLTHFYLRATHRSSQKVRGVQPPRTPHYQTCAAAQRRFPADQEEKKNWMSKIKRLQTRERWDERETIRAGGVVDEKPKRKEKEELFSKGWKPPGGLSQGEIPLHYKDTGAQDLSHILVGRTSVLLDVHEKKHKIMHSSAARDRTSHGINFILSRAK